MPNNYEDILNELVKSNDIEIRYSTNGNYESFNIISINNNIELENDELELIDKVKNYFQDYTVKEIVEYVHNEEAYNNTKEFECIDYNYSENINI